MTTHERASGLDRRTFVDAIADQLRKEILAGEILPGERIVVSRLEHRFNVSHIPIREAIRRLEAEGLLETTPQRATIATTVTLDDLRHLYDLRRMIEGEVAARAVARRTPEQLEELSVAHQQLEVAESATDLEAANFYPIHTRFHWLILAPAANPWIERVVVRQLWSSAERYVRLYSAIVASPVEESVRQHRGLFESAVERSSNEMKRRLEEHLAYTEEHLAEAFRFLRHSDEDGAASDYDRTIAAHTERAPAGAEE